jgi:hypothetical protein
MACASRIIISPRSLSESHGHPLMMIATSSSAQCTAFMFMGQTTALLQVLQAVTVPHADLAARVSKLSIAEIKSAQDSAHAHDSTHANAHAHVRKKHRDAALDVVEEEALEALVEDSENESFKQDPSGNGALEHVTSAGYEDSYEAPAAATQAKKSLRFAAAEALRAQHGEKGTEVQGQPPVQPEEPAFDFHGTELNAEDVAALAEYHGLEVPVPAADESAHTTADKEAANKCDPARLLQCCCRTASMLRALCLHLLYRLQQRT